MYSVTGGRNSASMEENDNLPACVNHTLSSHFFHLPFCGFKMGYIFTVIPDYCIDDSQKLSGNRHKGLHLFHAPIRQSCVIIMHDPILSDRLDRHIIEDFPEKTSSPFGDPPLPVVL